MKAIYWCVWWFTVIVWFPLEFVFSLFEKFLDGYGEYASKRYKIWRS